MSYIGAQTQNIVSPQFQREVVTGTGVDEYTLIQDVPGFNADNIIVVVNNVLQEPNNAYTITADANGNPRVLNFNGTNLATTDTCYVQHRGVGSLNLTPAAGSVNAAALQDNLRSGNVDTFTATANQTEFTLSETPLNANSISVFLGGVYQRPTTNYTVATNVLTLTSGANVGEEIDVHHHTIRSTVSHVPDAGVTTTKIDALAVTSAKIDALAVTSAKIDDNAVTNAKLSLDYTDSTYRAPTIDNSFASATKTIKQISATRYYGVNDVLVLLNGICLIPTTDYTISTTTLTLVEGAPATASSLVVRYLAL